MEGESRIESYNVLAYAKPGSIRIRRSQKLHTGVTILSVTESYKKSANRDHTVVLINNEERRSRFEKQVQHPENRGLNRDTQLAFARASSMAITGLAKYVDREHIQFLYPNLNTERIDLYDFSQSKIAAFGFTSKSLADIEPKRQSSFATSYETMYREGSFMGPVHIAHTGEKTLIAVDVESVYESNSWSRNKRERAKGYSDEERESRLDGTILHEILHKFRVGSAYPSSLREGITEYLAHTFLNQNGYKPERIFYSRDVEIVGQLVEVATKQGYTKDQVFESFCDNQDEEALTVLETVGKTIRTSILPLQLPSNLWTHPDLNLYLEAANGNTFSKTRLMVKDLWRDIWNDLKAPQRRLAAFIFDVNVRRRQKRLQKKIYGSQSLDV